jgi:uncharacterized protein
VTAILIGVIVGLVLGLTGAGGSIFAVPLLMAGLGWPIVQASTVSLLAVAVAAAVGAWMAWRQSYVRYRAASLMALVGVMVAPLGIATADAMRPAALMMVFAAVLLIVAVRMFRMTIVAKADAAVVRASVAGDGAPAAGKICQLNPATGRLIWSGKTVLTISLIGAVTGFLSGLLGVGGGFVIVPALRATTPLSMHSAVATSLMAIALISLGTVGSGVLQGRALPWMVALPFVVGAVIGMVLGRVVAPRIAGPRLQQGFAVMAGVVALGMIARAMTWL